MKLGFLSTLIKSHVAVCIYHYIYHENYQLEQVQKVSHKGAFVHT